MASDTPTQPIPSSALLVEVSINPEFAIHLDEQGNILKVEYINAEAEILFGIRSTPTV